MSDSNRIHALPLHLANQIAAGEVIERPASVVKELVENSIDADANLIDIDIEGAGNQLIRVRDNGQGIHPDDLILALSRHATSKLHSSEQLSHISSLGFRGEALPSITSISQLTISSCLANSDHGWKITGDNSEPMPTAHPQGTTIEVRDLFFNLPARRHFLRSNKTELHHILTTLQRLALSKFEVGFHCKFSAKSQLKLPIATTAEQQQQRIAKICGKAFINNSVYLQQDYDEITLHGWLGKPEAHRAQTDVQHFFINGRVIRDRVINHAIRQAYGALIPAGRQAAYVLYLTLPLERVDINVHPTKHEVRFRDARLIHGLITSALQEALAQDDEGRTNKIVENKPEPAHIAENVNTYQTSSLDIETDQQLETIDNQFAKVTSLLHQRYAIVQTEQTTLLLDLQQAEQQLRAQQLDNAIKSKTVRSRPILVPLTLTVEPPLLTIAEQFSEFLYTFGIQLVSSGDKLLIKSIPSLLAQADIKQLIHAILSSLAKDGDNIKSIQNILKQYLPLVPITSPNHAQQVTDQLILFPIDEAWCKSLDQQTLIGLF